MRCRAELPDGDRFLVHEPARVRVRVENDEGVDLEVPPLVGHDEDPVLHLTSVDDGETWKIHPVPDVVRTEPGRMARRPRIPLAAGDSLIGTFDLARLAGLRGPGHYRVQVEYWWDEGSWRSEPLAFEIIEPVLGGVWTGALHDGGSSFSLAAWNDDGHLLLRGIEATLAWGEVWFRNDGVLPPEAVPVASVAPPRRARQRSWVAWLEEGGVLTGRLATGEVEDGVGPVRIDHGLEGARLVSPGCTGWSTRGVTPDGYHAVVGEADGNAVLRSRVFTPDGEVDVEPDVELPGPVSWCRATVHATGARLILLACEVDRGTILGLVRRRSLRGPAEEPTSFEPFVRLPSVLEGDVGVERDGRVRGVLLVAGDPPAIVPFAVADPVTGPARPAAGWPVPVGELEGPNVERLRLGLDGAPHLLVERGGERSVVRVGTRIDAWPLPPLDRAPDHLDLVFGAFDDPRVLLHETAGGFRVRRVVPARDRGAVRPVGPLPRTTA